MPAVYAGSFYNQYRELSEKQQELGIRTLVIPCRDEKKFPNLCSHADVAVASHPERKNGDPGDAGD